MKRSGTIHTIHELSAQGKSIHAIARELGIARNTVRRYLRGKPEAVPHPKRASLLDPYKAQIHRWMQEDHLYNCEAMLERLREQGYKGNGTILRDYVRPLHPRNVGHAPVMRYETRRRDFTQLLTNYRQGWGIEASRRWPASVTAAPTTAFVQSRYQYRWNAHSAKTCPT